MEQLSTEHAALLESAIGVVARRSGYDATDLMRQSVGRAILRSYAHGGRATVYERADIEHVGDWLVASLDAGLAWLDNLDAAGVPKKFAKFSDVASVLAEAQRGMERLMKAAPVQAALPGEEVVVAELRDGYVLVGLKSPEALDRESKAMQHCVGLGGYDEGLAGGALSILSLRDAQGKPHVTMEVDEYSRTVTQIKGKQNRFPLGRYFDMLVPWMAESGLSVLHSELAGGYFGAKDGSVRHFSDLKDGETIDGDLFLRFDAGQKEAVSLPRGLRITGRLNVSGDHPRPVSVSIGPGTTVDGEAWFGWCAVDGAHNVGSKRKTTFTNCAVGPVPDGTRFETEVWIVTSLGYGDLLARAVFDNGLTLIGAGDTVIPSVADIRRELIVTGFDSLSFQAGCALSCDVTVKVNAVGGRIDVADLTVAGNLSLSGMDDLFGTGLVVGGDLTVMYSGGECLPVRMDVGALRINTAPNLKSIPSDAVIRGDVSLINTAVIDLGGRTRWPGDLRISKTPITSLPDGLKVEGSLEVSGLALERFPARMDIGGSLTAKRCPNAVIPEDAQVGGSIDLSGSRGVSLPDGFRVNGSLNLDGAHMSAMPSGVTVGEILHLADQDVDRVTRHFTSTSYAVSEARIVDISDFAHVEGDLWIAASDIGKLPEGAEIGGKMVVTGVSDGAVLPDGITVGGYVAVYSAVGADSVIPASATVSGGLRRYDDRSRLWRSGP